MLQLRRSSYAKESIYRILACHKMRPTVLDQRKHGLLIVNIVFGMAPDLDLVRDFFSVVFKATAHQAILAGRHDLQHPEGVLRSTLVNIVLAHVFADDVQGSKRLY